MKIFFFLFILLTLAEIVFTALYYYFTKKMNAIILVGAIIYCGSMILAFITYEVEKYRREKKEFIDSLP